MSTARDVLDLHQTKSRMLLGFVNKLYSCKSCYGTGMYFVKTFCVIKFSHTVEKLTHIIIELVPHPPWSRMPVRIVVSLLRALIPTSVPVGILTSVLSCLTSEVLISSEESCVPLSQLAVGVVVQVLMHSVL